MTGRAKILFRSGAAAVALIATSGPGSTQDRGGLDASLSFSQGFVSSSEDGSFGRTDFGFNLSNVTRTQDLQFQVDTAIEQRFDDGFDAVFEDPRINLSYGTQTRQASLDVRARYQRADVDEVSDRALSVSDETPINDPLAEDPLSNVLVLQDGQRDRANLTLAYQFGREARFGGTVTTSYDTVSYSGTQNPDLVDSERLGLNAAMRFDITPRIATTLTYGFSETDRSGTGQDVRNMQLRAGADLTVSQILSAQLSVGVQSVETTSATGDIQQEDGIVVSFDLAQDRPNGVLAYALNTEISETGRESNLSIARTFETRSGGQFSGSLGLVYDDDGNLDPKYQLRYGTRSRQSAYSIFLNQDLASNDLGQNALNTRIGLTYDRALDQITNLQSSLDYQTTRSSDDRDASRLDLSLGLARDLTQDWSVSARYTHSVRNDGQQDRDTENRLFVGLQTNFGWRP